MNKIIGCGSITDGLYKLEIHILNFNIENYSIMDIKKGDRVQIIGTLQSTSKNFYLYNAYCYLYNVIIYT